MKPLYSELLAPIPQLAHGFGWQSISLEEMLPADVKTFSTKQVHGDVIAILEDKGEKCFAPTKDLIEADAFITNQAQLACAIRTADCVPLLMCDPQQRVVAAVHAGWRGTAENIAVKTVQKMCTVYGCEPENILVAIGPSICGSCYEVGPEVVQAMQNLGYKNPSQTHVDVTEVNKFTLLQAGVKAANIELLNVCTKCSGKPLASYRRDGSGARQVSFIFLK